MDQVLVEQLLRLLLPVALIVLVINIASRMTGIGKNLVKRLTEKIVSGLVAIVIIWMTILAICQHLHR